MAGVPAGMLAQVVLVVILGTVPGGCGLDTRGDWPLPTPRRADTRDDAFRDGPLLFGLREDRRAVLRPRIVALAVERRGIVQAEEPALEQLLEAEHRRVEGHADRLGVAGFAVVRVVVGRVLEPAARVTDLR